MRDDDGYPQETESRSPPEGGSNEQRPAAGTTQAPGGKSSLWRRSAAESREEPIRPVVAAREERVSVAVAVAEQPEKRKPKNRRTQFTEYLEPQQIEEGVRAGKIFEGEFIAMQHNKRVGFARVANLDWKVWITDDHQNRAIHGQTVYFRFVDKASNTPLETNPFLAGGLAAEATTVHLEDDDPALDAESSLKVHAEVVGIKDAVFDERLIVGSIQRIKSRDAERKETDKCWFVPMNKKLPKFFVVRNTLMREAERDDESLQYFYGGFFLRWHRDCQHPDLKLTKRLGKLTDIEANCRALLVENEIYSEEFGAPCLAEIAELQKNLDEKGELAIPEHELQNRPTQYP